MHEDSERLQLELGATTQSASPLAPLEALLAAVGARTRVEGSMAPDCRMLEASLVPEGREQSVNNYIISSRETLGRALEN